jgi:hypothetical protein
MEVRGVDGDSARGAAKQEFISSTNNLESFKEVMEKICSKNVSKQAPHL